MFRKHIFFCTQQRPAGHPRGSCAEKGANDLGKRLWEQVAEKELEGVRVNAAGCLGRCDVGPVLVIYPQGDWYTFKSPEDVDEIVEKAIVGDEGVERLKV